MLLYQDIVGYTACAVAAVVFVLKRLWAYPWVVLVVGVLVVSLLFVLVSDTLEERARTAGFFKECRNNPHIDARYSCDVVLTNVQDTLRHLLSEFMTICDERGIKPIMMAGGLIGWQFDRKMLPFDDDIDFYVSAEDVFKIVALDGYKGNNCFFEVNPHWSKKPEESSQNQIDARLISSIDGVFIDVTFLLPHTGNPSELETKFPQDRFFAANILPPQRSEFEGISVWVPADPTKALVQRYGEQAVRPSGHGPPGRDRRAWSFVDGEWHKQKS